MIFAAYNWPRTHSITDVPTTFIMLGNGVPYVPCLGNGDSENSCSLAGHWTSVNAPEHSHDPSNTIEVPQSASDEHSSHGSKFFMDPGLG